MKSALGEDPLNSALIRKEAVQIRKLQALRLEEESNIRQLSRIMWLDAIAKNSNFCFFALKSRHSMNYISRVRFQMALAPRKRMIVLLLFSQLFP